MTISIRYLLLLLLLSIQLFSSNEHLLNRSDILITDKNLTVEEVDSLMRPYNKMSINTGMGTQEIWIRFTLDKQNRLKKRLTVYLSSPIIEKLTIYKKSEEGYKLYKRYKYLQRDDQSPFTHFSIANRDINRTFLLHIEPLYMPMDFSLKVLSQSDYREKSLNYIAENIALFGFIFALALYSFILYFFTKDKSFIYYSFYLFFLIWHQFTYVGMTAIFTPYSFILFDAKVANLKIGLLMLSSILYAVNFLKVNEKSTIYRLYLLYFLIVVAVIGVAATMGLSAEYIVVVALLYIFFNFIAGVIAYRDGVKEARLFIVGFGIVAICYTAAILDALGFISVIELKPNILLYATAVEALILSIAFADRYTILQKEKQEINALRLQESHNRRRIIEQKVEEKTHKLDAALKAKEMLIKEVHHRVKNNLQIILSMLRMQSMGSKNLEVQKKLKDLENRINAIAKSYEMLLVTEDLEKIDMKKYILALVRDISQAYNFTKYNIKVVSNIDAILPLKQAVYIGLIINELITNAFEHGKAIEPESKIYVHFKNLGEHYELIVEDNCSGRIPTDKKEYGLGLKFIDALVRNQLEGEYEVEKKRITIRLKL